MFFWIEDLRFKSSNRHSTRKTKPVLVIQTNFLNNVPHPSIIVCPITKNVIKNSKILRVQLNKGTANLLQACDFMIDQIRAIDNKRLTKRIGVLPDNLMLLVRENVKIVLDLE